jgi:glycosyltransferase involved in cell wall biosynthesis
MKIGFMANYFYPATGGMEELTFGIAKELAKRHEVHVFTSDRKDGKFFAKEEEVEGVKIHRSRLWFGYKYYLKFNPGIAFKHLKYDLDVLHFQSLGFIFQDIGVLLRRVFTRTKLINTPHGPFMALDKYPWWQEILRKLFVALEYPFNLLYHNTIQVNPSQYRWMKKYGLRNIKFIPNSIPAWMFNKVKGDFVKKYKLENKFVISYIGRVQKYKGQRDVVKVLKDLGKDVVFLCMGGEVDGEFEELRKIAKEEGVENKLIITGRVSDEEKLQGLDASDVFILPSEWEAFGIVLIEAMARGCALVSTRTEGGKFVVGKEEGFLYDYKNLEELKKRFVELIKNDDLRERMKTHNANKAKQYLVSNVVRDFERVYR